MFNGSEIAAVIAAEIGSFPEGQRRAPLVDAGKNDTFPRYAQKVALYQRILFSQSKDAGWFCAICNAVHGARKARRFWPRPADPAHQSEYWSAAAGEHRDVRNGPKTQPTTARGWRFQDDALGHRSTLAELAAWFAMKSAQGWYGEGDPDTELHRYCTALYLGCDSRRYDPDGGIRPAIDTGYRHSKRPDSFRQFANSYNGERAFCLWTPHPRLLHAGLSRIRRCERCDKSLSYCECPPRFDVGCPYCGRPTRRMQGKRYCAASVRNISAPPDFRYKRLLVTTRAKRELWTGNPSDVLPPNTARFTRVGSVDPAWLFEPAQEFVDTQAAISSGFPVTKLPAKRTWSKTFRYPWGLPGIKIQPVPSEPAPPEPQNDPAWEEKLRRHHLSMDGGTAPPEADSQLTPRQKRIAALMSEHRKKKEIAVEMRLSVKTVWREMREMKKLLELMMTDSKKVF